MKQFFKQVIGDRGRLVLRRLGRLRWLTKVRSLRHTGTGKWNGRPLKIAGFVLLDPEIDTYSYEIENLSELTQCLSPLLGQPAGRLQELMEEARRDPELTHRLTRDIGWRVLFLKRRPPLAGHHLAAYVIVRAIAPASLVETGILDGLGSRTILRALNRGGKDACLRSFDVIPGAGVLVPQRLRARWEPVYESTRSALPRLLSFEKLDFFLHDSLPEAEHQRFELSVAIRGARPGAVIMTTHGWTGVLQSLAQEHGLAHTEFKERPSDHFYDGRHLAWARIPP